MSRSIPEKMQTADLVVQFEEWAPTKYAPRSVSSYMWHLKKFVELYGLVLVEDLRLSHVVKFHNFYLSRGYSDASVSHAMNSVKMFFKFLYHQQLVNWDYRAIGVPKYVNKSYQPATTSDGLKMLAKIDGTSFKDLRDRLMISMLYSSGVRNSELCDLRIDDIQWSKGYAVIISKKNRVKRMVFWDTKTQGYLMTYMPLRDLVAKTDRLFISCDRKDMGAKIGTRTVQRIMDQYRPRKEIKAHSFRHGLGMRAVQSGIHPRHIQKILGHKHITSSQIYMDVNDVDLKSAYDKINKPEGIKAMEQDLRNYLVDNLVLTRA